jgi:hypothetical protein
MITWTMVKIVRKLTVNILQGVRKKQIITITTRFS